MAGKKVVTKLPHIEDDLIEEAIEGIIKGYKLSDLVMEIKAHHSEVELEMIEGCCKKALSLIREQTLVDIDKIIPQHVEIYEKLYKLFDEYRYVPGKIKAMKGKEKLLGLHKESNFVEIHNEMNIDMTNEIGYDVSKLSLTEQTRMAELMKLASIKEDDADRATIGN